MKSKFFYMAVTAFVVTASAAVPLKSWIPFRRERTGRLYRCENQRGYPFLKYVYYGEEQPVMFTVDDGNFEIRCRFGNAEASRCHRNRIRFYSSCNKTKEAWISALIIRSALDGTCS